MKIHQSPQHQMLYRPPLQVPMVKFGWIETLVHQGLQQVVPIQAPMVIYTNGDEQQINTN